MAATAFSACMFICSLTTGLAERADVSSVALCSDPTRCDAPDYSFEVPVLPELLFDLREEEDVDGPLHCIEACQGRLLPRLLEVPDKRHLRSVRNVVGQLSSDVPENTSAGYR